MGKTKLTLEPFPRVYAGTAGALYLVIIITGVFSEVFVRGRNIVDGDSAATLHNILASGALFKTGFVADSIMLLSDVAIAILLYVLLRHVHKTLALIAAVFRLIHAAILGMNLLHYYAAYLLVDGGSQVTESSTELILLFLKIHSYGYDLGLIFFGVSNLVLGYLVIKSQYFAKVLGYGLQAAGVVYIVASYTRFLAPGMMFMIEPLYLVPLIAELSFCLWLLSQGGGFSLSGHDRA